MNNKENYKKAIENIHASEKLKRQTFEKITENRKRKLKAPLRVLLVVFSFTLLFPALRNTFRILWFPLYPPVSPPDCTHR